MRHEGALTQSGTEEVRQVLAYLQGAFPRAYQKIRFPETTALGIKPVSREGSERLIAATIRYALDNHRRSVTFVHKGNIMKLTEGAFRNWGYALAERELSGVVYT